MAVPAPYAEHATATYEGRWGTYTWTLYGPSAGAPGTPASLRLSAPPRAAFGTASGAEFGGGLIAHSVDLTFSDGGTTLDGLLDGADPADYLCSLTGPRNAAGDDWTVWCRPIQGETHGSASPLLSAGTATGLGSHDGLATLEDERGGLVADTTLADIFGRLWIALPGGQSGGTVAGAGFFEVWASWPITAGEMDTALIDTLRPSEEIVVKEEADGGSVMEQLRALAEGGCLSIYQPTDADPVEPRWEVAPRSRVGTALSVTVVTSDGAGGTTVASGTMPDRAEVLPPFAEDKARTGARSVRRASALTFKGERQLVFAGRSGGALATGESEAVAIGRFTVTPGLRFRVRDNRFDPGPSPLGSYRLELDGDDATTYYGPDWGTSTQSIDPDGVTTADLPVAGEMSVVYVGETSGGDEAVFNPVPDLVSLEDAEGDAVTSYALTLDVTGGKAVSVALLPSLEAYNGTSWVLPTDYDGLVSGDTEASMGAIQAAERAAQQGADLRALVVRVRGLYGPEARFTLGGSAESSNARSPFAEDCTFVPVAGEPDLETGFTDLVLVSAAES